MSIWRLGSDAMIVRDVFVTLRRLELLDGTTSFNEFVEWMGELSWYANIYKPK